MARPQEDRPDPDEEEWVRQHQAELARFTQPAPEDTLPAWVRNAGNVYGDVVGSVMGGLGATKDNVLGAMKSADILGSRQKAEQLERDAGTVMGGLNWLGENVSDPIVGAGTAVMADTAENIMNLGQGRYGGDYSQTTALQDLTARRGGGIGGAIAAGREYKQATGEGFRRVREDPNAPAGERIAGAFAGGLQTAGDFAAPVAPGAGLVIGGVRVAAKAAPAVGRAALDAGGALRAPLRPLESHIPKPLDEAGVTDALTRSGVEPDVAAEAARKSANPPADLDNVIPFPGAVAPPTTGGTNLGDLLARATTNKQKRMTNLVKGVLDGEKVPAKQAQELLDFARAEMTPADADNFERILRPIIDEQDALDAALLEAKAAGKEVRQADLDVKKTEAAEARAEQATLRAEMKAEAEGRRIDATEARADVRRDATYDARADRTAEQADEKIARVRQNLEELKAQDGSYERVTYTLSKADAERLSEHGYQSAKDIEVLNAVGLNIGKVLDADEAQAFAKTVRDNPEMFKGAGSVSHADALQDAARKMGMDPDDMVLELRRRGLQTGDQSAFLLAANLTIRRMADEYRDLLASGASKEVSDAAYAKFMIFSGKVGGANSEAGRTLGVLRINRQKAITDNIYRHNQRVTAEKSVAKHEALVGKAEGELVDATMARDEALAAVDNARDEAARKAAERFAETREKALQKAQANMAAAQAKLDAAKADFEKAVDAAVAASEKAHAAALKALTKGGISEDARKMLLSIDPKDATELAKAMRNLHKITNGRRAATYAANNLYSSLHSLEANALGVAGRLIEFATLQPLARLNANVISWKTGQPNAFAKDETWARQLAAMYANIPKAGGSMLRTMLDGMDDEAAKAADIIGARPFRGKKGLPVEWALRANSGADTAGRTMVGGRQPQVGSEARMLAWREARRELGPNAHPDEVTKRQLHYFENPTPAMLDEQARMGEGTNYGARLGVNEEKFLGGLNIEPRIPGLGETPLLKMVIGPTRFVYASTKHSFEAMGFGFIRAAMLARKGPEFHRQAAYAAARAEVGSVTFGLGLWAHSQGILKGKDPEGRNDDSILINGQWISLRPFWPLSGPLIYAARIGDANARGVTADDKLGIGVKGVGEAIINQPVLRFTADVFDAAHRGGQKAEQVLGNLVATRLIPSANALRDLDRIFENVVRKPEDFWAYAGRHIPLINKNLEPIIGPWGEQEKYRGGEGPGRLHPFPLGVEDEHPLTKRLKGLGINVEKLDDKVANTTLTGRDLTDWHMIGGTARKEAVERVVNSQVFESLSTSDKHKAIKTAMTAALNEAKVKLAEQFINSGKPETQARGIGIGLGAQKSPRDRVNFIEKALPLIDSNPQLAALVEQNLRNRPMGPEAKAVLDEVMDGDTVRLTYPAGTEVPGVPTKGFRLAGVNTPEKGQPGYKEATAALAAFLEGKKLTFQTEGTDFTERPITELKADGVSVSDWLIQSGHGKRAFDKDTYDLGTYRKVIPVVKEIEAMPKYALPNGIAIGEPEQWARAAEQKKSWEADEKKGVTLAVLKDRYPDWGYYKDRPKNPVRARRIEAESKLIFGGTGKDKSGTPILQKFIDKD